MNNIIESTLKRGYCIGCGICSSVCPENIISIKYNENKEYQPVINEEKCVGCGICTSYCPNTYEKKKTEISNLKQANDRIAYGMDNASGYFWCKDTNRDNLLGSASGGFVTAFAGYLLRKNQIDCVIHVKRSEKGVRNRNALRCGNAKVLCAFASVFMQFVYGIIGAFDHGNAVCRNI